jgi:predicted dehydrogenase
VLPNIADVPVNDYQESTMSRRVTRRQFLATACVTAVAPTIIRGSALGKNGSVAPSNRIVLGGIGIGARGQVVLGAMLNERDAQFVAVCDVKADARRQAKLMVDGKYGNQDCAAYRDLFEVLDRKDIDAVLIATGDRWHGLASILAVKAGKDVYSEKPVGVTMNECIEVDEAVRRYGRVFTVGTQRRSIQNFRVAIALARSGKLGRLRRLHASVYYPQSDITSAPAEPEPDPDTLDWDRWLGPAPWRPFNWRYVRGRGWQGFDDFTAAYVLMDWGAHTVDLCQAAAGADGTTPVEYIPSEDNIVLRYADGLEVVMDFLHTPFGKLEPHYRTQMGTCPVRFEGDEGWVETGDNGDIIAHPESLAREVVNLRRSAAGTDPGSHVRNFFDCVKSRGLTNADGRVMRSSHVACHAAGIAWKLGRTLRFDPDKERFIGSEEANRMCTRAKRAPWYA